jgi:hypothetical protein
MQAERTTHAAAANPYASPTTPTRGLSRAERNALEFCWKHRDHRPSIVRLAGRSLLVFLATAMMALAVLVATGLFPIDRRELLFLTGMCYGLVSGVFALHVSYMSRLRQLWPMYQDILNWPRIAERLGHGLPPAPAAGATPPKVA